MEVNVCLIVTIPYDNQATQTTRYRFVDDTKKWPTPPPSPR